MARPKRTTTTEKPNATADTELLTPAPDAHAGNGSGNGTAPRRRRGRPPKNAAARQTASATRPTPAAPAGQPPRQLREVLTVESVVAIESPREFRLHPRGTAVAWIAEAAGAKQLFVLSLRGGLPRQLTASEKPIGDPQWSPDGRRLAYTRDNAIWIVEADGSRATLVSEHPAGTSSPRWSPDGARIAFLSRRRGWSQVWVVDAPVPRRGRPAAKPKAPEPRTVTATGFDVETFEWSLDGATIAVTGLGAKAELTSEIRLVDVASGREETMGAPPSWETGARWMADGSLLYLSDADGWFQVIRRTPDGRRTVLTTGQRERGEPSGEFGWGPLASPDGTRFSHAEFRDGFVDLLVAAVGAAPAKRGRGRPPKNPPPVPGAAPGVRIDPWDGVWRAIGWTPDGAWIAAIGESESRPQDLWLLPVPGVAPDNARPRQVTESLPAVLAPAFGPARAPTGERFAFGARDRLRIEGTLWRPPTATGRRGGTRVPAVVYPHGGPTAHSVRGWSPFKQLLVREGFAFLDVDFRGSTGYGRAFRHANVGEWGNADARDMVDAAKWAADQPWCDGRLAIFGGSYGGYLTLCALTEEPGLWRAGVDLYGDSEIAESFRHGDRLGRLDLERMMGSPDDPKRAAVYRRGSPVYRADRIEAPLLILHGRKDKRVVPLMTERMVEALTIEGKHHEVQWYDEEGHGWEKRETKRDAYARIIAFLRRHVMDETKPA